MFSSCARREHGLGHERRRPEIGRLGRRGPTDHRPSCARRHCASGRRAVPVERRARPERLGGFRRLDRRPRGRHPAAPRSRQARAGRAPCIALHLQHDVDRHTPSLHRPTPRFMNVSLAAVGGQAAQVDLEVTQLAPVQLRRRLRLNPVPDAQRVLEQHAHRQRGRPRHAEVVHARGLVGAGSCSPTRSSGTAGSGAPPRGSASTSRARRCSAGRGSAERPFTCTGNSGLSDRPDEDRLPRRAPSSSRFQRYTPSSTCSADV